MTGIEALAAHRIGLIVGSQHIAPGDATLERILDAVERHDERARIPGLADELNPAVLDPARVRAFVEGLGRVPSSVLDALGGRSIVLAAEGLGLGVASPVGAEALARGYTLELPEDLGAAVLPVARAEPDAARALALVQRAREATGALDAEVARLGREPGQGGLLEAKQRRFAAAKVWAAASRALAELHPGDAALADDARAAIEAVRRSVTMPRMGMPRPPSGR
jgi:hypothetical protein